MTYLNDTQRVEMALPAHIMLAVLIAGANCADPGPAPVPRNPINMGNWQNNWKKFNQRLAEEPGFAESHREFLRTKELLATACAEPLFDLTSNKASSIIRRVERLHDDITRPYVRIANPDPRKIGLIAYYLLSWMVETRYLIVPPDSAFGRALDVMLPGLSPWEGSTEAEIQDYDNLNKSALKQAKSVLKILQSKGYYHGVEVSENI